LAVCRGLIIIFNIWNKNTIAALVTKNI